MSAEKAAWYQIRFARLVWEGLVLVRLVRTLVRVGFDRVWTLIAEIRDPTADPNAPSPAFDRAS